MTIEDNLTEHSSIVVPEKPVPVPLMTEELMTIFETVNVASICCVVGLFGMTASVINMVVFVKQGLNTTVNISLFSLSLSDFCGLAALVWLGICMNPLMINGDILIYSEEVGYVTGAWPHACFARITCWLTAYITAERCVCIALPLKSKQIITPRRTAGVMCLMYAWTISLLVPQYMVTILEWNKHEYFPRTVIRLYFKYNLIHLEAMSYALNTANGAISFAAVTIFTIILIVKLRQQRAWRKTLVAVTSQAEKEKKTMFMVLMISILLICCYAPGIVASLATYLDVGFRMHELNESVFVTSWSFFFVLEVVNSSVNIFFYYRMSTKYKKTFHGLFAVCDGKKCCQ